MIAHMQGLGLSSDLPIFKTYIVILTCGIQTLRLTGRRRAMVVLAPS